VHVAAPLFHTWGWAHLNLSMLIGSTLVLRCRFEPEDFLRTLTGNDCDAAVVVPVMLQRVLELPDSVLDRYDLSAVQAIAASGSALSGELSTRWMDRFGDHLYNIYGSTECAWVTIASPGDLRQQPGTAGRVPIGTTVRLLDADGRQVPDGEVGRVHVANSLPFEGYTGGPDAGDDETGDDETGADVGVDGLMPTGDLGRWRDGLLFVEGRDDEMIVSGGENVYPTPGRGLPRHPPRRRRGGRGRCRRRRVRAAAERVRRLPVGSRAGRRGDRADVDQVAVVGLCGPAGRVLHRRAAAQRDREGGQAPPRSRRSVVTDERYKACSL